MGFFISPTGQATTVMHRVLKKVTIVAFVPVTVLFIKICSHYAHVLFLYSEKKKQVFF